MSEDSSPASAGAHCAPPQPEAFLALSGERVNPLDDAIVLQSIIYLGRGDQGAP